MAFYVLWTPAFSFSSSMLLSMFVPIYNLMLIKTKFIVSLIELITQLAIIYILTVKPHYNANIALNNIVTIQNGWNNRISYGCVYAQIRSGSGMHLGTYSNHDTVLFLLIVPIKGRFFLRWNSLYLYLSTLARFPYSS